MKVFTENGRVPITRVHVDGNLDSYTSQEFLKDVRKLIEGGSRYLLLDLEHTPIVTSAGMRAIHTLFNELRVLTPDMSDEEMRKGISEGSYKSPHLKLVNVSKDIQKSFSMGGFDMYIDVYDDLKKAIDSF